MMSTHPKLSHAPFRRAERLFITAKPSITPGPNLTDAPRRAYILVFGAPPKKRDKPAFRPWQTEEREALANARLSI